MQLQPILFVVLGANASSPPQAMLMLHALHNPASDHPSYFHECNATQRTTHLGFEVRPGTKPRRWRWDTF